MKSSTFELGLTKKIVEATFSLFAMFWYRAFSPRWSVAMQIETEESFYPRKKFNCHRIGLAHQHGCRFTVLVHQHGGHGVMRKKSNCSNS